LARSQTINHRKKVKLYVKDLFFSDNPVVISRVSAILDAEDIEYVVLGGHASLLGGGIPVIQSRVMVDADKHKKAVALIRAENLENDMELKA